MLEFVDAYDPELFECPPGFLVLLFATPSTNPPASSPLDNTTLDMLSPGELLGVTSSSHSL